jgi:hypothetical protein
MACRAANPVAWQNRPARFPSHVQRSECESCANRAGDLVALARRRDWGARDIKKSAPPETPSTGNVSFPGPPQSKPHSFKESNWRRAAWRRNINLGSRRQRDFGAQSGVEPPSPPAGDIEQRAGHVRGGVADQPDRRRGDLLSSARASHRRGGAEDEGAVWFAAAGMNIGVDEPRADGVDPDPLGAELLGEAQGQCVDRALDPA